MTVMFSGNCVLPESLIRLRNFESKNRNMNGKMDEKEVEDRLVAAEAMSALASLVLVNPVSSTNSNADVEKPATKKRATRKKDKGSGKGKKNADKHENTNNSSGILETGASVRPERIVKANGTTKPKNSNSGNSGQNRKKSTESKQTLAKVSKSAVPADTQCIATQTVPVGLPNNDEHNRNSLPSINLGLNLFSSNLFSLPSIPSIDALKLPQNIDLTAFPNVNTVDLVLGGGYNRPSVSLHHEVASSSGQDEGERSLPFKKRRLYANTSEERFGADVPMPSLDLSGATPFASDKGKQPESKQDSSILRSIKINPQFSSQLMREINIALTQDEDGDLPLHIAVVHENLAMIKKFIQLMKLARRSVDKFNKQKQTPLHLAVKLNLPEAIKMLLEADADINYVDQNGCTSLHLAVQHRLPHLIDLFYNHSRVSFNMNTRNFEGFTPLHTAVSLEDDEMINILLEKGIDIDIVDGKSGRTALFHAVEAEKKAIVCLLLKRGANAEILNYAGNTAIMAAHARNLRDISGLLTCKSNDIPDYELDSSSRSSSVEIQDKPPGLIRIIDDQENKLSEVPMTSLPTSILSQSQMDLQNPIMGKSFRLSDISSGMSSKEILDDPMDQPLDLHVEKKPKKKSEKQVSPERKNEPNKMDVDPQPGFVSSADIVMEDTNLVISISENGTISTEQSLDTSNTSHRNMMIERISPHNQVSNNLKLSEKNSAIRTVLTSSQQSVSSAVMTVTSIIPTVTYTSQRTPVTIPSGIPTYIKPELKAKIQQNLMNKKLKAQISEEKKD